MQSSLGAGTTRYPFSSRGIGTHHEITISSIGDGIIYLRDNPASEVQFVPQPQLPAPANLRGDGYRVLLIESDDSDPTVLSDALAATATDYRPDSLDRGREYRLALVALGNGQNYRNSDWTQAELAFTPSRPPDDDDDGGGPVPTVVPRPTNTTGPECDPETVYTRFWTEQRYVLCYESVGNPLCLEERTCFDYYRIYEDCSRSSTFTGHHGWS